MKLLPIARFVLREGAITARSQRFTAHEWEELRRAKEALHMCPSCIDKEWRTGQGNGRENLNTSAIMIL